MVLAMVTTTATHDAAAQRPAAKPLKAPTANAAAATAAVRQALRAALAQPTVRNAVRAEISRQLRANQPVALIDGVWVTAIDMGKVYGVPTVRDALVTNLPAGGGIQIDAAALDPGRIGLAFTPGQLASLLGPIVKDLMGMMGVDAMQGKMTDFLVVIVAGLAGVAAGTALMLPTLVDGSTWADWLGYGNNSKREDEDSDFDGDKVKDKDDAYPADPDRAICDCSGRGGIFFGTHVPTAVTTAVPAAYGQIQAQARVATSLGAIGAGQTASIRIVVP